MPAFLAWFFAGLLLASPLVPKASYTTVNSPSYAEMHQQNMSEHSQ